MERGADDREDKALVFPDAVGNVSHGLWSHLLILTPVVPTFHLLLELNIAIFNYNI